MKHDVSVIIPSRPNDPHLDLVVESVKMQKHVYVEIIVVFNPTLPAWSSKGVRVLQSKLGVNSARNTGLRFAEADYIYFLDSDTAFSDENDLSIRLQKMQQNKSWAVAGGPYILKGKSTDVTKAYNFVQNYWLMSHIQNLEYKTPFLLGGNILMNRKLTRRLMFDENMIYGGTEKEFFCRLKDLTQQIFYVAEWPVEHLGEITTQDLRYKAKMQARGTRYIERKGIEFHPLKTNIITPQPAEEIKYLIKRYHEYYRAEYEGHSYFEDKVALPIKGKIAQWIDQIEIVLQEIKK